MSCARRVAPKVGARDDQGGSSCGAWEARPPVEASGVEPNGEQGVICSSNYVHGKVGPLHDADASVNGRRVVVHPQGSHAGPKVIGAKANVGGRKGTHAPSPIRIEHHVIGQVSGGSAKARRAPIKIVRRPRFRTIVPPYRPLVQAAAGAPIAIAGGVEPPGCPVHCYGVHSAAQVPIRRAGLLILALWKGGAGMSAIVQAHYAAVAHNQLKGACPPPLGS